MLSQAGKFFRRWRRRVSRSELLSRWFGYDVDRSESRQRGLIILQLDGLSRRQFEAAIAKGRLPFLRKMSRRKYFRRASFYSGIPSATPAVQAEVMYGKKCAVPAFQFLHRESGKVLRMFDHEAVQLVVETELEGTEPLLAEGASYSNIYSGGAEEARCCVETSDVTDALTELNPVRVLMLLFLYFFTALRVLALTTVEMVVAVWDMVTGMLTTRDLKNELKFVPARVLIAIVLREWARITIKIAISRGTKIIYTNFLGYDEQSHRRGPSSAFAHWGLKGIDKTIEDIYRTARRSDARDYEIVVFSDHGQEAANVYEFEHDRTVEDVVHAALRESPLAERIVKSIDGQDRRRYLDQRMRRMMKIRRGRAEAVQLTEDELMENVIVTAMGPLGHIYFPVPVDEDVREEFAKRIVLQGEIPLALYRLDDGTLVGRNERGCWKVDTEITQILGPEHKFPDEVRDDLFILANNRNAGEVMILGWDPEKPAITFAQEHGAHGSVGFEETRGFALLPFRIPFNIRQNDRGEDYLRGVDIHRAALDFINNRPDTSDEVPAAATSDGPPRHDSEERPPGANAVETESSEVTDRSGPSHLIAGQNDSVRLRVMTYNTHQSIGLDGKCRPGRIAEVIAASGADLIALQEVDVNRRRSGSEDQAVEIAARLGMYHRFFPVWSGADEHYGLAILSRVPLIDVHAGVLTESARKGKQEARGAMWVRVDTSLGPIHLINTHFGLRAEERRRQVEELLSERWLDDLQLREPVIIAGDLNAGPKSKVMKELTKRFHCVQVLADDHRPQKTFASVFPVRRIDHVLVSRHFQVNGAFVPRNHATAVASDHLPVCADLELTAVSLSPSVTHETPEAAVSGGPDLLAHSQDPIAMT
ncbi:MAG: hypothetical protein Fues2KO_18940 [Fuerstiella sp.]